MQSDIEGVAQTELARHRRDLVRSEPQRGLIEKHVARRLDRVVHVERAVALVAVEDATAIADAAVAGVGPRRIDTILQRRQRHHGLEGRSRRIGRAQGLVEQRLAVVGGERTIVGTRHPLHELVGVEARRREQAEHVAVADVHHHRRAAIVAEDFEAAILDVGVERQLDRGAGLSEQVAAGVPAHHTALDVDLDLPRPRHAAQGQIERLFDAPLADPKAGIKQDRLGVGSGFGDVFRADLRDVADDMREGGGEGVDPDLAHIGRNAGKLGRADVDAGKLLPTHVLDNRHRRAAGSVLDILLQALQPRLTHRHELGELAQRALDVDIFVLGEQQAKVWAV